MPVSKITLGVDLKRSQNFQTAGHSVLVEFTFPVGQEPQTYDDAVAEVADQYIRMRHTVLIETKNLLRQVLDPNYGTVRVNHDLASHFVDDPDGGTSHDPDAIVISYTDNDGQHRELVAG